MCYLFIQSSTRGDSASFATLYCTVSHTSDTCVFVNHSIFVCRLSVLLCLYVHRYRHFIFKLEVTEYIPR